MRTLEELSLLLICENKEDKKKLKSAFDELVNFEFSISETRDIEDARKRVENNIFDLIILDLELFGNYETGNLEELLLVSTAVPTIVLSNQKDNFLTEKLFYAGVEEFLIKNEFDSNRLLQSILHAKEMNQIKRELKESQTFLQSTLNALNSHIAILDEEGKIIDVNSSWREFADENDLNWYNYGIGSNYLEIAKNAFGQNSEGSGEVARAIEDILNYKIDYYHYEYPCHSNKEYRWFILNITRFEHYGRVRVVTSHENITSRKLVEKEQYLINELSNKLNSSETSKRGLKSSLYEICDSLDFSYGEIWFPSGRKEMNLSDIYYTSDPEISSIKDPGRAENSLEQCKIVKDAVKEKQINWIEDIEAEIPGDYNRKTLIQNAGFKSAVSIPVIMKNDLTAVLVLFSKFHTKKNNHIIEILQTISSQISFVLERIKYEKDLLQLSRTVEQSPEAVILTDKQGIIEYVNPAFEKLFKYTREDVIGGKPSMWGHPQNRKNSYANIRKNLNVGESWSGELTNLTKEGETLSVYAHIAPIQDAEANIINYVAIEEDITELKKIERENDFKEEELRNILDSAMDGIIITDLEGRIFEVNKYVQEKIGIPAKYMESKKPMDLRTYITDEKMSQHIKEVIENGYCRFETRYLDKVGNVVPIEAQSKLIDYYGKKAILSITRDISERKNYENELLKAKEKAEDSDKIKSEFLAQISHEIRTPLNNLISMSSIVKEECYDLMEDEDSKEIFGLIESAGNRIIRTVDSILNMADLQIGRYEPRPVKIDLYDRVIKTIYYKYTTNAEVKGINFKVNKQVSDTSIKIDEYSAEQIFSHLIDNAVKFTNSGEVSVDIYKNGQSQLYVSIKDTGIGMDKESISELIEPFRQEDEGYARKYEGNGLGLSLVKKFADLNNVEIFIDSEKNKGTTVTVMFANPS